MDELIARSRHSREALSAVIARFSDQQLIQPGTLEDWSARDLMAHIAAWDSWVQRALELYLTSDVLPADMQITVEEFQLVNDRVAEIWKSYDAAQARAALDKSYADLINFLISAPHERLYRRIISPTKGKLIMPLVHFISIIGHDDEHRAHLEAALSK